MNVFRVGEHHKAAAALKSWELSRFMSRLPKGRMAVARMIVLVWAGISLGGLLLLHFLPHVEAGGFFLLVNTCVVTIITTGLFGIENAARMESAKEWWLGLPLPRYLLVRARFLAYCTFGWSVAAIGVASAAGAACLAWLSGAIPDAGSEDWYRIAASTAIVAASVPFLTAAHLFSSVFFRKQWYWLLLFIVHFVVLSILPPAWLGIIISAFVKKDPSHINLASLPLLWSILAGMIAAGWPLTGVMLRTAARFGLPNLSDPRLISRFRTVDSKTSAAPQGQTGPASVPYGENGAGDSTVQRPVPPVAVLPAAKGRGSLHALYSMERDRYRPVAGKKVIQGITWAIYLGLAVGGFFACGYSEPVLFVPLTAGLVYVYIIMLALPLSFTIDINSRRITWFLSIPVPRWQFLAARAIAAIRYAARSFAGIYISFWTGILGAILLGRESSWDPFRNLQWGAYTAALGICLTTAAAGILLFLAIAGRALPALWPVLSFGFIIPVLLADHWVYAFYPGVPLLSETSPYWGRLALAAAAATLIAVLCIRLGGGFVDRLSFEKPKQMTGATP